jgi:hypothetical protein
MSAMLEVRTQVEGLSAMKKKAKVEEKKLNVKLHS